MRKLIYIASLMLNHIQHIYIHCMLALLVLIFIWKTESNWQHNVIIIIEHVNIYNPNKMYLPYAETLEVEATQCVI